MKKRILVTLMVMSLIFAGITACGGSEKKETTPATETTAETTAETEAVKEYAQGTICCHRKNWIRPRLPEKK